MDLACIEEMVRRRLSLSSSSSKGEGEGGGKDGEEGGEAESPGAVMARYRCVSVGGWVKNEGGEWLGGVRVCLVLGL
jgi:hypothetical protein